MTSLIGEGVIARFGGSDGRMFGCLIVNALNEPHSGMPLHESGKRRIK